MLKKLVFEQDDSKRRERFATVIQGFAAVESGVKGMEALKRAGRIFDELQRISMPVEGNLTNTERAILEQLKMLPQERQDAVIAAVVGQDRVLKAEAQELYLEEGDYDWLKPHLENGNYRTLAATRVLDALKFYGSAEKIEPPKKD